MLLSKALIEIDQEIYSFSTLLKMFIYIALSDRSYNPTV